MSNDDQQHENPFRRHFPGLVAVCSGVALVAELMMGGSALVLIALGIPFVIALLFEVEVIVANV